MPNECYLVMGNITHWLGIRFCLMHAIWLCLVSYNGWMLSHAWWMVLGYEWCHMPARVCIMPCEREHLVDYIMHWLGVVLCLISAVWFWVMSYTVGIISCLMNGAWLLMVSYQDWVLCCLVVVMLHAAAGCCVMLFGYVVVYQVSDI